MVVQNTVFQQRQQYWTQVRSKGFISQNTTNIMDVYFIEGDKVDASSSRSETPGKFWKRGAGEGWKRSVGLIMWEMKMYHLESRSRGISFTHLVVCLTTGPKPLPKRALHIVRSRASSFKWEYPLLSLRSSNSFLRLLPCLPVTSIPLVSFLKLPVVEGSFDAKCDQSSSPSVYVFHVGYSSAPWL